MNQYDKVGLRYVSRRKQKESTKAAESAKFLLASVDFTNKSILDLGCGDGSDFKKFYKAGATSVFGIDNSIVMIEQAEINIVEQPNSEVCCLDIADISFQNKFDVIIAKYSLHYLTKLDDIWQKLANALKTGGELAFTVPHPFFETYLKPSRDYSVKENIDYVTHGDVLLSFPSHTVTDYLSVEFLKYFNIKKVWEYTKNEELVDGVTTPVILGIIATKR